MKKICTNSGCGWCGDSEDALKAVSPFDEEETIYACPNCRDICSLQVACDEPGCCAEATCGTPTPDGYRMTCGEHYMKLKGFPRTPDAPR